MSDKSLKKRKQSTTTAANSQQPAKKLKSDELIVAPPAAAVTAGAPGKKSKKRKKRVKSSVRNPARLPTSTSIISSNWEQLKKEINLGAKPKRVTEDNRRPPAKFVKKDLTVSEAVVAKKPDIWFDDVDEMLLDPEDRTALAPPETAKTVAVGADGLVKEKGFKGVTRVVGMDCEMVGVGYSGEESILARVSLVNHFGHCIYDKFVKPTEKVTNYRTEVSGIRPNDIKDGEDFKAVQKEVSDMLQGRVLVGHALKHDLKVLFLTHPKKMIRDTSSYKPFRNAFGGKTPSLKNLTARMLGVTVQEGEHSSVQDAQAAVRLYTMFRKEWEKSITDKSTRNHVNPQVKLKKKPTVVAAKTTCPKYQDSDSE